MQALEGRTGGLALDFGAGDGWFAMQFVNSGLARRVVAVDVLQRSHALVVPILFDGMRLPFADATFDLTFAIDVLHHCSSPERAIAEALRCTKTWFLCKDHTYNNGIEWATLCVLDELGNRRFGVPSPHRYQARWAWDRHFERHGFVRESLIHPVPCHRSILGRYTNHLQFVSLWRRDI